MAEAGYTKVGGVYTSPTEGRLSAEAKTNAAADNEAELAILASGWRDAGFDMREAVLPAAQAQDSQMRSTFPGAYVFNTNLGDAALLGAASGAMPRPENRWSGSNYGGWSNPEYDRLYDSFNTTLDRAERDGIMVRLMTLVNDELPGLPLYYNPRVVAHTAELVGPRAGGDTFNVHDWELRSGRPSPPTPLPPQRERGRG